MNKNLNDKDLNNVIGGADIDIRKDLYENIIIGSAADGNNPVNRVNRGNGVILVTAFNDNRLINVGAEKQETGGKNR